MTRMSAHRRRKRVRRLPLLAALIQWEPLRLDLKFEELTADLDWGRPPSLPV